jgi:outer membrane protein assembly factor BamB
MRVRTRVLGIAGMALFLAGCWPASGQGPSRQAFNPVESKITPATVASLVQKWSAATDGALVGDPVVSNNAIHVSDGGNVYGFDRRTGARLWVVQAQNPGIPFFMGQPSVDGSQVLVGTGIGNLGGQWQTLALDAATGAAQADPGVAGLVDSIRGSVVVTRRSSFGSNTPVAISVSVTDRSNPNVGWGGLIDLLQSGQSPAPPMTLGSARVYQGGQGITATNRSNGVRAYPVATAPDACPAPANSFKCPMWNTPVDGGSATSPVIDDAETTVYAGTSAGTLYALDAATGAVLWTAAVGSSVTHTPALANGKLYVPTASGDLQAFDATGCGASTCSPLWTASTGSSISAQPAVAGGVVYTGSDDGTLAAFDASGCGAATCPSLWSVSIGSRVNGAPAVTNGRLYVGTADGHVLAYGLP